MAPKPTTAPAAAAPTATPAAAAKPAAKLKGEIIIANWHISSASGVPSPTAQKNLVDGYNKFQPDVKVTFETQVGGDYITWLGTQLAAGTPRPDIVSVNYQPSYKKFVDFIKYKDVINPYTGNPWSKDFDFEYYGAGATAWTFFATQTVTLPWFYNMDLFDKAGAKAPTTWEEWMDACDKILTKTGVAPIGAHYNNIQQWQAEVSFDQYHRDWVDQVRAQKGDWNYNPKKDDAFKYDPKDPDLNKKATYNQQRLMNLLKAGKITYADAEMTKLMTDWAPLGKYVTKDFWVGVNRYALFLQQKCAMMPDATWSFWTLDKDLTQMSDAMKQNLKIDPNVKLQAFKSGLFNYPSHTGSLIKGPVRSIESIAGEYLGAVDKTSQQTELDADFMMYWLSKAGYQQWIDGNVKDDVWTPTGKMLISGVNVPEKYTKVLDAVKPIGNAETWPNGFVTMYGGYGTLWQREAQDMVKGVMDGTVKPSEFGTKFQALITEKYWSQILEKLGYTEENIKNPALEPKK